MDIVNANTLEAEKDIFSLASKIKKMEFETPDHFRQWLKSNLGTDVFNFWLAFDNDRPVATIGCQFIDDPPFIPSGIMHFAFAENDTDVMPKLVELAESWLKKKGAKKVIAFTRRSYRAFERKYKYKLTRVLLSKELTDDS